MFCAYRNNYSMLFHVISARMSRFYRKSEVKCAKNYKEKYACPQISDTICIKFSFVNYFYFIYFLQFEDAF